jgi:hypothetical protein
MSATRLERTSITPPVPHGQVGITLAVEPRSERARSGVVAGAFRVTAAERDLLAPIPARLGLVAQQMVGGEAGGISHVAATLAAPFSKRLIFDDDTSETPGFVEGAFRVDLRDAFGSDLEPGVWIVFAVLGVHSSTPIQVEI